MSITLVIRAEGLFFCPAGLAFLESKNGVHDVVVLRFDKKLY